MATYTNPSYNRHLAMYGLEFYETDKKPESYRGYLIYQRIPGSVWDVVKDGACVAQRAGPNGARAVVDNLLSTELALA